MKKNLPGSVMNVIIVVNASMSCQAPFSQGIEGILKLIAKKEREDRRNRLRDARWRVH